MKCPSCNNNIKDMCKFCPKCGLQSPGASYFANEISVFLWKESVSNHRASYENELSSSSVANSKDTIDGENSRDYISSSVNTFNKNTTYVKCSPQNSVDVYTNSGKSLEKDYSNSTEVKNDSDSINYNRSSSAQVNDLQRNTYNTNETNSMDTQSHIASQKMVRPTLQLQKNNYHQTIISTPNAKHIKKRNRLIVLAVSLSVITIVVLGLGIFLVLKTISNQSSGGTSIEIQETIFNRLDNGNIVIGHYEQDGDESNGAEPIEWQVLYEDNDEIILISKYILDVQLYNSNSEDVTWETCELRRWLNDDFYNKAFNSSEQDIILSSELLNPNNELYGTEGGNNTIDKVYCLSVEEANYYFGSDSKLRLTSKTTKYAKLRGCVFKDWWLRSPGIRTDTACAVSGEYGSFGWDLSPNVYNVQTGVRPVIRINNERV